ncbi:MAG: 3-dehydroquinate synthase [Desulfobacteraceae bacterium]|nr:3-dehydroquinate synthase [Desulfobacteraceae bacterium]
MMETFHIKGITGDSSIYIGEKLQNVDKYLPDCKTIIITDENVKKYYSDDFPDFPVITISTGESIKTLATVESIYRQLIDLACDRQTFILAIGGGIVCDIAGFVASTFQRGLRFGFVSTSLLSQVDASVGGKNGVNFDSYKNMVGVFMQPEFVICDIKLLNTLPKEEVANGFAEIVKHALIKDHLMFDFIEKNKEKALNLDPEVITQLVTDSIRIKSSVVQKDEKEAGERRKLNFGHTIGHAIEKIAQPGHGNAVSLGIVAAADFSCKKGYISKHDFNRITSLLYDLNLPVEHNHNIKEVVDALQADKKRAGDFIYFIFLSKIGKSLIEKVSFTEIEEFLFSQA